ncbi:MAG: hypothetical protein WDO06_06560 [Actinomycetota bacterium]
MESGKREPYVATFATLVRSLRHSVVTIPTVRSDAAQIAYEISIALKVPHNALAYRRFIQLADNLEAEVGATKVGLTLTERHRRGVQYWDLALAALCEYRLNRRADCLFLSGSKHGKVAKACSGVRLRASMKYQSITSTIFASRNID